jgi:hypothetical protein
MSRLCLQLLLAGLLAVAGSMGQVQIRAALSGIVIDDSGGSIANARVTVRNRDTGFQVSTESARSGFFLLPALPPGVYELKATKDGFAPTTMSQVEVTVGENADLRLKLAVSSVTESINVVSSIDVQRQSAEISGLVSERRISELPLNGKDFQKLIQLAPGVGGVPPSSSSFSPSIGGGRSLTNNYTIDGVASNDERVDGLPPGAGFSSPGNSVPAVISTEAIAEFRIITSNADASFGQGSGGQINVVTKSGTNDYHGAVYEYLRNDAMDARDFFNTGPFFDKQGRAVPPPFRQNLFGGSVGGRISRDRHFFFANYEGFRQRRDITSSVAVPNASLIGLVPGDLGSLFHAFYIKGGIVPSTGNPPGDLRPLGSADRAAAVAAGFTPALFDGNLSNGEAGIVNLGSLLRADIDQDAVVARTDHYITNKLRLSLRFAFSDFSQLGGVLGDQIREPRQMNTGTAQLIYAYSPAQLFETRLSVVQSTNQSIGIAAEDPNLQRIGVTPEEGIFVSPDNTGLRFIRVRSQAFSLNNQTVPQITLLHSLHKNRLTVRSGLEVRQIRLSASSNSNLPSFTFNGFVGPYGLLGSAPGQGQAVAQFASQTTYGRNGGPTTPLRGFRSTQFEAFVQTDWRVTPAVTLNLGLRYSYFGVYSERQNALGNMYALSQGQIVDDVTPLAFGRPNYTFAPITDDRPMYQPDRNNFQPRIGLSWSLGGKRITVLRAGYGIYHDRLRVLEFSNLADNTPFAISTVAPDFVFRLGQPIPVNPQTAAQHGIDPTIRNPYTQRFNIGVEHQLGGDTTITGAYVGARGRNLFNYVEINAGSAVPQNLRPDPRYGQLRLQNGGASSNYDSLQIFAKRRFAKSIDFTAAYTYAQSKDNASRAFSFNSVPTLLNLGGSAAAGFQGGGTQWVDRPRAADWGYSDFDLRHALILSHYVELPFGRGRRFLSSGRRLANVVLGGWSFSGILAVRSGSPFEVNLGTDVNDDGFATDRPMLASGASLDSIYARGTLDKTQFLIPSAQAQQSLITPQPVTDPFNAIERNYFHGPSTWAYDTSLAKRFTITERMNLGFEANAFNLFNHTNLGNPNANVRSSFFGSITGTVGLLNPRQIQFGLKLTF